MSAVPVPCALALGLQIVQVACQCTAGGWFHHRLSDNIANPLAVDTSNNSLRTQVGSASHGRGAVMAWSASWSASDRSAGQAAESEEVANPLRAEQNVKPDSE